MSDVPNREQLEAELAKKLGKLFKSQMARLLELMGDPPNMSNVPQSFWDESGGEFNSVVIPFLEKQFADQAAEAMNGVNIGVDWTLINERAATWARQYTYDLVTGINQTTQAMLNNAISDYYTNGMTIGDLENMIAPSFGPVRAEMIAVTEVTRSSVQGELALSEELRAGGIQMREVWNTNNDELVCPICGPHNQQAMGDGWEEPPPAHPRCRCWVNLELPKGV